MHTELTIASKEGRSTATAGFHRLFSAPFKPNVEGPLSTFLTVAFCRLKPVKLDAIGWANVPIRRWLPPERTGTAGLPTAAPG